MLLGKIVVRLPDFRGEKSFTFLDKADRLDQMLAQFILVHKPIDTMADGMLDHVGLDLHRDG